MTAQPVFEAHFPPDRDLSWEDLQTIPDDQHWAYQIFDGTLIVSPAPDFVHQLVVAALLRLLEDAAPPDVAVLPAPFDYAPRPGLVLQPDVVVARGLVPGDQRLEHPPLLVVEVLSPRTRVLDGTVKRAYYEETGVPAYWMVDPGQPSLTALELEAGRYVEVASVRSAEEYAARAPFPVRVVPAALVARRG